MSPDGIGRAADSALPSGLDWDFYLGPAPRVPFNKNRFLVSYRWFWDYAGGMATDYGTHRLDSVHPVMGVVAPQSAAAAGGRFELADSAETPDALQIPYEYPGFVLSYEASMLNDHGCGGRTLLTNEKLPWVTFLVCLMASTTVVPLASSNGQYATRILPES